MNLNNNNSVDIEVQKMLSPLNLMQYTMFCPKYRIKNGFIYSNSLFSNFVSMIVTAVFICLSTFGTYLVNFNKESLGLPTFMILSFNLSCIYVCIGFILNFVIGINQTGNNVAFVLIFQTVHRLFNKDRQFILWNLFLEMLAVGSYFIIFTCFLLKSGLPFYSVYYCNFVVVFDFNIIYAMRLIQLLESKMNQWNLRVTNSQKLDTPEDHFSNKEFQAFVDILTCYNLHAISFQPLVSFLSHKY